jgi:GTP pyrophosphokinase
VRLEIVSKDRPGLLAEVSGAIAETGANITQASVEVATGESGVFDLTVEVSGRDHLRRIIQSVRKLKAVERVKRTGPHGAGD